MAEDRVFEIWQRLLNSGVRSPSPESLRYFLQLKLPDEDRERMETLGHRAQSGSLTTDERAELEAYSHAAAFLTILQSQARSSLRPSLALSNNGAPAA